MFRCGRRERRDSFAKERKEGKREGKGEEKDKADTGKGKMRIRALVPCHTCHIVISTLSPTLSPIFPTALRSSSSPHRLSIVSILLCLIQPFLIFVSITAVSIFLVSSSMGQRVRLCRNAVATLAHLNKASTLVCFWHSLSPTCLFCPLPSPPLRFSSALYNPSLFFSPPFLPVSLLLFLLSPPQPLLCHLVFSLFAT